jgi:gluconolactonase
MEVVATDLQYPEGPVALADGSVLVVEIAGESLKRIRSDGHTTVVATIPGSPNGAAIGPDEKVFICNNGGLKFVRDGKKIRSNGVSADYRGGSIEIVTLATGKVERLYERCGENLLKGPNDLVFDKDGVGFWFTDFGKRRERDMDRGYIYWARADGSEIREVIPQMVMPNGIGVSPDGKTLYVAETHSGRLFAFEITGPGEVKKSPWPAPYGGRLVAGPGGYTQFDSLAVTASGRICVANPEGPGIFECAPDGSGARFHEVPDMFVTNMCFGGSDLRTCYITCAYEGRLFKTQWHEPGLLLPYQKI